MIFSEIDSRVAPEVLRLNNNEVPHVNQLDAVALQQLCSEAALADVGIDEYAIPGVILGFEKGAEYSGFNYNWFCQRYDDFLYVDRIIVNPAYRGKGVGLQLYKHASNYCTANGLTSLCCEVNGYPANPVSHQFHLKAGFEAIESVVHPEGKTVVMYRKDLTK